MSRYLLSAVNVKTLIVDLDKKAAAMDPRTRAAVEKKLATIMYPDEAVAIDVLELPHGPAGLQIVIGISGARPCFMPCGEHLKTYEHDDHQ